MAALLLAAVLRARRQARAADVAGGGGARGVDRKAGEGIRARGTRAIARLAASTVAARRTVEGGGEDGELHGAAAGTGSAVQYTCTVQYTPG